MSIFRDRRGVCRCLFLDENSGPLVDADAAEVQNSQNIQLEREHLAEMARFRERWNFDFETETPLEGNWEWEKVESEPQKKERTQEEHKDIMPKVQKEENNNAEKVQSTKEGNHTL